MNTERIRVVIADAGYEMLARQLESYNGERFDVVSCTADGNEVYDLVIESRPDVLLMDEATSALDPISTAHIEELAVKLKERYTVIMVTHNMQQAQRIADKTAFFYLGEMVEYGETRQIFENPQKERTIRYISGHFG